MNTILVVEDNNLFRDELVELLGFYGFRVLQASNVEGALQLLQHHEIELIIADYLMPRMTGVEFLKIVKSNPKFETLSFILLTAVADETIKIEAQKHGVDAILYKPCPIIELLATVSKCLLLD